MNKKATIAAVIVGIAILGGIYYYVANFARIDDRQEYQPLVNTQNNQQKPTGQNQAGSSSKVDAASIDNDLKALDAAVNSANPSDFSEKDLDTLK
ncbi:MAG: hypothetical protein ACM3NH_01710 [Candidatus Saccharibacteria bacterium]